ncbi:MAG TPA: DUF452 domain-containing protein [Pasteurellaceae bacterium]|nr:DUF452 domain-containing protein [Pasteurellaceae bacterium]
MKIEFSSRNGAHLLVYFAGWGTPVSAVSHLELPADYNLLICYDYRDLSLDFDFSRYDKIRVVAWSMGVWAADYIMRDIPLVSATAVNGTGFPSHDQYGIPCDIFKGTLDGLNEATRVKFERRMCGDKSIFMQYQQLSNPRSFSDVQAELAAIYQRLAIINKKATIPWTRAFISMQDRIFPAENQQNYWQNICEIKALEGAHYPFLQFSRWEELWQ